MVILPVEVGGDKDRTCCIYAVSIVPYLLRLEAILGVITNQVVAVTAPSQSASRMDLLDYYLVWVCNCDG